MSIEMSGGRDRATPVGVAYDLMRDILFEDPRRPLPDSPEFRAYVLDLYAECLAAARGRRRMRPRSSALGGATERVDLPGRRACGGGAARTD